MKPWCARRAWVFGPMLFGLLVGCSALSENPASLQATSARLHQEALERLPDQAATYHRLAVLADQRGEAAQAISYYQQAYRLDPHSPELLNDLGYTYFRRGDLAQAEQSLRLALEKDPGYSQARNNLGTVLGHQGQFGESLQAFRQVVPEAEAYANLAFVHVQRGETAEAQRFYQHALNLNPSLTIAAAALAAISQENPALAGSPRPVQAARYDRVP